MGNHWNRIMSQGLVTSDIAKLKRIVGHMDAVDEMTLRDFKILLDFPEDRFDPRDFEYLWLKSKVDIRPLHDGSKWEICCKFKKKED